MIESIELVSGPNMPKQVKAVIHLWGRVCGSALARKKAATIWSYSVCALDQKLPGNKKSSTHGAGALAVGIFWTGSDLQLREMPWVRLFEMIVCQLVGIQKSTGTRLQR